MNLTSLPIVGQLYLPFLLTSLIIGMVILILLEKRKTDTQKRTLKDPKLTDTPETEKTTTDRQEEPITQTKNDYTSTEQKVGQEPPSPSHSSSCSSSGSDEEATRPRRVARRPKKKHACKGSAITCATKRKVTAVTIITDSQEEEVKVSLEDLAEEIRRQGVACSVHSSTTTHLPPLSSEPSHLLLLFGTTSEGCKRLQEGLMTALGGGGSVAPSPPPQPFLFTVSCWSTCASGDVFESARDLSTSLAVCGGAEWLPVACITPTDDDEGDSSPPVMGRQQYVKTVLDKITKPGKKCCGTSCGSKTVDIEDLASSLLLSRAAVTS